VRNLLAEAVAELHLDPGQTYRTTVDDYDLEIRRRAAPPTIPAPAGGATADDERSQFADMVMMNIVLNMPPSPNAIKVQAKFGPLPPPDPPIIPPDDEVAE
jgi:hypothetical protein